MSTAVHRPSSSSVPARSPAEHSPLAGRALLLLLWLAVFAGSLASPPLLDDADATHAQAAQAMLHTGDWVTLHVNGVRYLEKPPLPYWIAAGSMKLFGENAFAVHLPLALTVLGLALLGRLWARRAFNETAGTFAALFTLTAAGVFLFTRIFIPDALLALLLACALYTFLNAIDPDTPHPARNAHLMWAALACAVLTKGLVSLVFFFGAALVFLVLTKQLHAWRRLAPLTGSLLFLAIAAPWHILAGLRNTGGDHGHGFFWFYFVNEHVLRFLGRRVPRDYNKLPGYLYWTLHLVWLFPWSFFAPAVALAWWRRSRSPHPDSVVSTAAQRSEAQWRDPQLPTNALQRSFTQHQDSVVSTAAQRSEAQWRDPQLAPAQFQRATILLLTLFSALVLLFFAFSTNQEYYTFPVYLPLLILLAGSIEHATRRALNLTFAALTVIGLAIAAALAYGLWSAHTLPFNPDIGSLLAHRGVGDYTLSMSHFFDLTGASFAALRLPATLALLAFAFGPACAWLLFRRDRLQPALTTLALSTALFLIAAHIALGRFGPMLSSKPLADTAARIEAREPNTQTALFGDQAYGSSIPFYLGHRVLLVDGRSTSMWFGSTFPDAPHVFLTHDEFFRTWGTGPRKLLFVPLEKRDDVEQLLGPRAFLLQELSGKALLTDRPLP